MNNEQLVAGFTRNRRFFIAVSLALTFVTILRLEFTEISLLGNSATVTNPSRVILVGWVIWAWAAIQYCLWFRDAGAWSEIRQAVRLDCRQRLQRDASEQGPPEWLRDQLLTDLGQRLISGGQTDEDALNQASILLGQPDLDSSVEVIDGVHMTAKARTRDTSRGYEVISNEIRFEVRVEESEFRRRRRRAWLVVLLTRRYTLEYLAPFVIGALPVAVRLWVGGP